MEEQRPSSTVAFVLHCREVVCSPHIQDDEFRGLSLLPPMPRSLSHSAR